MNKTKNEQNEMKAIKNVFISGVSGLIIAVLASTSGNQELYLLGSGIAALLCSWHLCYLHGLRNAETSAEQ